MKKITQKTLARYTILVNQAEALGQQISELKDDLIDSLNRGIKVEVGPRIAKVKTSERRSVCWKNVVIRIKSFGYAQRVLAATKPISVCKLEVR